MYHINIPTIHIILRSDNMYISWLSCLEVKGNDGGMKAAKPETTVQDCVSPFVSVKPLDTSNNCKYCNKTTRRFQLSLWQLTKPEKVIVPKPHQTIKQVCHNMFRLKNM